MSHNKRCYVKKINKSAAQGSRRVDLMFKQASRRPLPVTLMFVTRIWGLTQSLRRHVLSQTNQSVSLICLRPLALDFIKNDMF